MKRILVQIFILLLFVQLNYAQGSHSFVNRTFKRSFKKPAQLEKSTKKRILQDAPNPQKMRITYDFTALNSIANEEIKNVIKENIKLTINFYQDMVKVKYPVSTPFSIPADSFSCDDMYTYSEEQKQMNTDLHILVTYVDNPNEWYLAYAGGCYTDDTGRNVLGVVNFNIGFIDIQNDYDFYNLLVTTEHELFHVIALNTNLYSSYFDENGEYYPQEFYQNEEGMLKFPKVQQWVRDHYNCQSLEGMYLENEGTSGSAGVHWEKVVLYDETMNAAGDEGYWSDLNNAVMEDSGWYEVDRTKKDKITYGKDKGCDFFINKCFGKQQYSEFCQKGEIGPSVSYHAAASCQNDDEFTNKCYVMKPFKTCFDPRNSENAESKEFNEYFGYNSRVFYSSLTPLNKEAKFRYQCYKYECQGDSKIKVYFGDKQLNCDFSQQEISSPDNNFQGALKCPDIKDFCSKQQKCVDYCSSKGYCINTECVCIDGYSGPGCQCPPKQYYNSSSKTCQNCSDQDNCLECNQNDNSICLKCSVGYFLKDSKCEKCSVSCKSCETSSDKCTSCKTEFSLTEQNTCIQCPKDCAQCLNDGTTCLACIDGKGFDDKNTCTATCKNTCKTCKQNKCLTCQDSMYLKEGQCYCREGTFWDEKISKCRNCPYLCKKCQNETTCDLCIDTYSLNQQTQLCNKCQDRFFENDKGECKSCHYSCQSCSGAGISQCTSCFSDSQLTIENQCLCLQADQYMDKEGFCQQCQQGCLTCTNSNSCASCADGTFLNEKGECIPCNNNCKTCKGPQENQCKSCKDNLIFNDVNFTCGKCQKDQFLDKNDTCTKCSDKCQTCKTSADQCITDLCKSGEYYVSEKVCNKCSQNCLSCTSGIECNVCEQGYNLFDKKCISAEEDVTVNKNILQFAIILISITLLF